MTLQLCFHRRAVRVKYSLATDIFQDALFDISLAYKSRAESYRKINIVQRSKQGHIKVREFSGVPTKDDFKLVEEELPALKDGDVLFEATFLTVDPYMRFASVAAGSPMTGEQVARVTKSKNPDYAVGTEWVCFFGWRSHTVFNPSKQFDNLPKLSGYPKELDVSKFGSPAFATNQPTVFALPDLGSLPHSLALGTVGMPGATAYLGLIDNCAPKAGETVLVNGAAGAVGHVVGQIAKIKGCKVIGYAGTDAKVKWLKELGFDFAFNYKKVDLSESLSKAAPDGVDVYYDNVGGTFSDTVLTKHMKRYSRVVVIGIISSYNATSPPQGSQLYLSILMKHLTIRGFMCPNAPRTRWLEAFSDMIKWIKQGKLKYREHITEGFRKMPEVFIGLFTGENTGKAIIKI